MTKAEVAFFFCSSGSYVCYTPVFPIEDGDIAASYVSLLEGSLKKSVPV